MILKIINFYAVGCLVAVAMTFFDYVKYKVYFDEFEYEERHYMALFFVSSILSWYLPIKYASELVSTSGTDKEETEEAKIEFLRELKIYLDMILNRIFK